MGGCITMRNSRLFVSLILLLPFAVGFAQLDIKIDAEKDAYYNTLTGPNDGWVWLPSDVFNNNGAQPDDDADLSANWWSAWDETYLYVYEEINDDIVNQNSATWYQNDCIDAKIDPDIGVDDQTVFTFSLTAMDSGDVDLSLYGGIRNLAEGWTTTERPTYDDFARRLSDAGYVLELRLKWEWINTTSKGPISPFVGDTYGFAIMNHDNDNTTRDGSIEWAAVLQDQVWSDCKLHGYIELLADNKIKYVAENLREPANFFEYPEIYIPPAVNSVSQKSSAVESFGLAQNFPNPFNPKTTIRFSIPIARHVTLKVYDVLGCEVATLINGTEPAGTHKVEFDGSMLSSGIYYYRIEAGQFSAFKKLTLIK
jgi:hypothetical protein